jgi:RNA polymerase sigma-70 factor (ECF subfamily)
MLSFEELYLAYSPDVYRFAYWLSGDKREAEDITSDTFVRAWMNFDAIRTETLKAYLFTIARHIYLESLRKNHAHHQLEESHPDSHPKVERVIENQNELASIRAFLQILPEIDRSAFVLRVQYDLPYAEIARVLELSESAVKVKVHRVRKKLFNDYQERNSHE